MRLLVCGSRDYRNRGYIRLCIKHLHDTRGIEALCHGGARGTDSLAGEVAANLGIPCRVFAADWSKYGKAAGPIRNQEMLDIFNPDVILAFMTSSCRGTRHMVSIAEKAGKKVIVRRI